MNFYNVSDVRNFARTDPRIDNFADSFPNNDSEGSTHQEMYVVKRQKVSLCEIMKRTQLDNKWGLKLKDLAVGDLVGLFNIPSDSTLVSVGADVKSINGFTARLVLVDEDGGNITPLNGETHCRITTTETSATSDLVVGATVNKCVLLDGQYIGATKYIAFEVTALPNGWATCPTLPKMEFVFNSFNHLTSFKVPNVD